MKDKFENKHDRHSNQAIDKKLQKSYADHGHLMKSLNVCSKAFQKISRSYFQIKSNILIVSEALHKNYFTGISHTATKGILEYICQANGQIADYCKQYANQLNNLHVMYAQLVKQRYGEYKEEQHNYQHYLSKVESLSKSPQIDRFERNKDKLKNAYSSYQSKSNQLMQLLTATNQQTQKIWQKKIINFSTAFVRSYANVLKNTEKLIKDHEDDSIIIDEEDHDPKLVLKNTNSQKNAQDLHHRVEKMLNQAEDPTSQILVASYFKQNSNSNSAASKNIQKIFGPSRYKLSPQPQQASQQKLVKSCEVSKQKQGQKVQQRGKTDKFQSKNDFSIFENLMSQKKETVIKSTNMSPVVIQIPSARPGAIQKVKKNNQVNLLDL